MIKRKRLFLLVLVLQALAAAAQTQRWWGLYADSDPTTTMGFSAAETYDCAAQFASTRTILNGATIHGLRFYLRDKTVVSGVQVWLSTTRPNTVAQANIAVIDVPQEQLADLDHDQRMTEVTLPTPYTLGSGSIYAGFSFTVTSTATDAGKNPVVCAGRSNLTSGSFYLRTSKTLRSWNDLATQYGAVAVQLLVSNPSLPAQAVQVQSVDRLVTLSGQPAQAALSLRSEGLAQVNSIDYVVTIDGQAQPEAHLDLPALLWGPASTAAPYVPFVAPAQAASQQYAIEVTRVNGQPNESRQNKASNQLISTEMLASRRSVVEEFTGTWCTNCPRGTVGMENLAREFGDRFVGIAVHNGDPMALNGYQSLVPSGIPKCNMDRTLVCDPYIGIANDYHYHANEAFALLLAQPSEADLTLNAYWTDDSETVIACEATTTFYTNAPTADYALAFILTADGLRGTTQEWWQVNGESGRGTFPDADMDRFRNAPDPVKDMEYNHVAVAIDGITQGIAGSIASPIVSRQPQLFTHTYSIAGNSLVQDKTRLQANVLLINTTTGQVVNAAKAPLAAYDPAGLTQAAAQGRQPEQWHTLDGRRIAAPTRPGLYISNGKKIIIH
ncbi:MAG: hypothetical protein IJ841_02240 [Prevotella sp.]|nr:hypothetical protein [Prevotella sp.]